MSVLPHRRLIVFVKPGSRLPRPSPKHNARRSGSSGRRAIVRFRAGNGTRTRDPNLGKVVLYQLSYSRVTGSIGESGYADKRMWISSRGDQAGV